MGKRSPLEINTVPATRCGSWMARVSEIAPPNPCPMKAARDKPTASMKSITFSA
jgi:hypothetical protein